MDLPPRVWVVFLTYVLAAVSIFLASIVAGMLLHAADPDLRPEEVFGGLRGLIAGGLASSTALVFTTLVATRGMEPARLRLLPGRETGRHLVVMVVGVLALGQALDSLVMLLGLSERSTLETFRRVITGIAGPELFAAVVVIGVLAGTAEELFFRGYMQSLLRERWRPRTAVIATSACFAILHLDLVHGALAFMLGLYLGYVTELAGSALPAITCHVVNNIVFTLLTALVGSLPGFGFNVTALAVGTLVVAAAAVWLRRSLAPQPS